MKAQPLTRQQRLEAALVLALVCLALGARLLPGERIVDDAYITFRYARNLIQGAGLVYNPGEPVLGTTTPLYTALMAALALASGSQDFPALSVAANAAIGACAVALLYLLSRRLSGHWAPAAIVAALWAIAPYSVTFAVGGMETDLTVLLLLGASYAHITHRSRWLAVLSALALLARPDTALLLVLLWLELALSKGLKPLLRQPWRALPWREGLITLAVLAPWLIFSTLYFGSPLTNSVAAKSVAYRLPPTANLVRLVQHYATPFFEHKVLPPVGVVVAFAMSCGLCALSGLSAFRRERCTWPLTAYPFVYFAAFAITNPLLFRWYLSPPLPFYFLLIITGAWTVAGSLARAGRWKPAQPVPAPGAATEAAATATGRQSALQLLLIIPVAAWTVGLTVNAWELRPDHGPDRPAPEMAWFQLELLYDRAADVILARAAPGDSLCAGDIGRLGYKTDLPILDTVGLVTRRVADFYPADPALYVISYAIPAELVLALDPDFIVILEVYGRRGLLPDPEFQSRYHLLESLDTDVYGTTGMLIFERQHTP